MDGLDEFEKTLAAEKAERDRIGERKQRKHKHHHRDRSQDEDWDERRHRGHKSHSHEGDADEDNHRHKRSRHSRHERDGDGDSRRESGHRSRREPHHDADRGRVEKTTDAKGDLPLPDEEVAAAGFDKPKRDDWMTDPSALGVDYTQKGATREKTPPPKQPQQRAIHGREINADHLQALNEGKVDASDRHGVHFGRDVDYKFGDGGSDWRLTSLKTVYSIAERTGRPIDDVAIERYGNLEEFDDAREEKMEMDRRKTYGEGYVGKEKPSGELYKDRKLNTGIHQNRQSEPTPTEVDQGVIIPDLSAAAPTTRIDQTTLNKMRASMMKAKLRKAPDAAKLETDYNAAVAAYRSQGPEDKSVVLNVMQNRMLAGHRGEAKAIETKRGKERGNMEENEDMSIEDMVREERRTRGQTGGDGMRLAERIAKDGKFDNDLDYMDENATKLARRVQKSEINLKNTAVSDFQKMNKILDRCQLCHHEDRDEPPVAPIISLGTRVFLTLPTEPELSDGGAVIVPIQHRTNLLECDDDEWEELRNFMKCLTRMYHDQGREVIFYENAAAPGRHLHAAMAVVPIPYALGDTAPAFFKEAILSSDEEWSQHRKVIDTGAKARDGLGKLAFRRSLAKEMPYFHAWFTLDGGLGHVVEDERRWPRGDLFAREVIGGMLDVGPDVIKKQGRWHRSDAGSSRAETFKKRWRKFDWTRVLADG